MRLARNFSSLDGIFSDEHGDYPTGTYVRNPLGSRHAPRTGPGCTLLVKLRQMPLTEQKRLAIHTTKTGLAGRATSNYMPDSRSILRAREERR